MSNYIQLTFQHLSTERSEILIAQLNAIGFEGFEESENNLKAFIPLSDFNEDLVKDITEENKMTFVKSEIEETNWNAVWESSFDPVIVDDFVAIRADFHEPVAGVEHEILITPKMSFGTGHHATTYMMIRQMKEIDFSEKSVFDFGTGTGVLSILAEKLGAKKIIAVDNDDWSIENAKENIEKNDCTKIELIKDQNAGSGKKYDIILANINKNVILDNIEELIHQLKSKGELLLSGLLTDDDEDILSTIAKYGLKLKDKSQRNNWIALRFTN